jgi:FkbM family methyltransferase
MRSRLLAAYIRLPEHPAKYRVVRWLGRWAFADQGVVRDVGGDIRMYLHPRDWIEYQILRGNAYEPQTLEFLSRNIQPGSNVLLTGVNNGLHAIHAARATGPAGCVIGVEPQAAALLRARANFDLNGVAGTIRLVAAAVGDEPGLIPMPWSSVQNSGAVSLLDSGPGFVAPLLTLSTVIETQCPGPLRLMLLDVQGYEVKALRGMGRHNLPGLLIVEDATEWLDKAGSSRQELYAQLTAMGYALHDLFGRPISHDGPAPHEANIVGVQPGAAVSWLRG